MRHDWATVYPWSTMTDEPQEQTEQTPKRLTVPVRKRAEFFANLRKPAKPQAAPKQQQHGKGGQGGRRPPSHGSGRGR